MRAYEHLSSDIGRHLSPLHSVRYLTAEEILYIHHFIIEETGGSHGLRDEGRLLAVVARPLTSFGGDELFPTVFQKAAALTHGLIMGHPFVDGNKRSAMAAANMLLEENGWQIASGQQELEDYAVFIATDAPEVADIADWMEAHSVPFAK